MDTFQQDNRRFGITVDMMTPTILIPVKSDSVDLLLLKTGDLHVQNVFDITDVGQGLKQEWNHIYVSLTYVQLSRWVSFVIHTWKKTVSNFLLVCSFYGIVLGHKEGNWIFCHSSRKMIQIKGVFIYKNYPVNREVYYSCGIKTPNHC